MAGLNETIMSWSCYVMVMVHECLLSGQRRSKHKVSRLVGSSTHFLDVNDRLSNADKLITIASIIPRHDNDDISYLSTKFTASTVEIKGNSIASGLRVQSTIRAVSAFELLLKSSILSLTAFST